MAFPYSAGTTRPYLDIYRFSFSESARGDQKILYHGNKQYDNRRFTNYLFTKVAFTY